jgi:tRNA(Ile2) C34 agmatinyltransferase TiaS
MVKYPRCPTCENQLRGVGDVWYCFTLGCGYEISKKELENSKGDKKG